MCCSEMKGNMLEMPMMPVRLYIKFDTDPLWKPATSYLYMSTESGEEIPQPDCVIELSINGRSGFFTQSRLWSKQHVMQVTLRPVGTCGMTELIKVLDQSSDWKLVTKQQKI